MYTNCMLANKKSKQPTNQTRTSNIKETESKSEKLHYFISSLKKRVNEGNRNAIVPFITTFGVFYFAISVSMPNGNYGSNRGVEHSFPLFDCACVSVSVCVCLRARLNMTSLNNELLRTSIRQ